MRLKYTAGKMSQPTLEQCFVFRELQQQFNHVSVLYGCRPPATGGWTQLAGRLVTQTSEPSAALTVVAARALMVAVARALPAAHVEAMWVAISKHVLLVEPVAGWCDPGRCLARACSGRHDPGQPGSHGAPRTQRQRVAAGLSPWGLQDA